ncbi:FecR family protein [Microbulbifer thermotolerans]|uniref:FecR family protein n=1 Tax=Microbulbifer thermotolerans TaxID=252514 RepID=A0A143HHU1_MICTH|nr:FecR family protein [Microbulbifer thermotolerans]AMX01288.1 hypothetical protein A3224_00675 [Microbulbifer thermotolerans]
MAQGRSQKKVDDRAREWFMLRQERPLTPQEEAEFAQWMEAPAHRRSYRQLEAICRGLIAIAATEEGARLRAQEDRGPRWQARLGNLLRTALTPAPAFALALVLVTTAGLLLSHRDTAPLETYHTEIAQTRILSLADGSQVTLGADSQIEVTFSEQRRDVALLKGQAFFSVAADKARPFYVKADTATIRVVGTRFDVHRAAGGVKVSVEEGTVDVTPGAHTSQAVDNNSTVRLLAGQQIAISTQGDGSVQQIPADTLASWRNGKLIYRDARLAEVVADANRYREGKIILGAPHLADLRVTTAFSVDQVETMIDMLEESLPVNVYREADNRIVIWPRAIGH